LDSQGPSCPVGDIRCRNCWLCVQQSFVVALRLGLSRWPAHQLEKWWRPWRSRTDRWCGTSSHRSRLWCLLAGKAPSQSGLTIPDFGLFHAALGCDLRRSPICWLSQRPRGQHGHGHRQRRRASSVRPGRACHSPGPPAQAVYMADTGVKFARVDHYGWALRGLNREQ
jgi:hypothetical protein